MPKTADELRDAIEDLRNRVATIHLALLMKNYRLASEAAKELDAGMFALVTEDDDHAS